MVTCKCINKFRDKHNAIIGYRLKDTTGKCIDVTSDQVKVAIKNNQITVTNLTLTSDGRLVEHKENNIAVNNTKNPSSKQTSLENELKELATDDYQHRGGNYPRSGKPDTIQVYGTEIEANFKNTSESTAIKWLTDYLDRKGYKFKKVTAYQTGDYDNDWVNASTTVTGRK